jgi:hypothetical protein
VYGVSGQNLFGSRIFVLEVSSLTAIACTVGWLKVPEILKRLKILQSVPDPKIIANSTRAEELLQGLCIVAIQYRYTGVKV